MSDMVIIDTSILLNILGIPNKSQSKDEIQEMFIQGVKDGKKYIIPFSVIIETGNHISQNGDGNVRRSNAIKFCEMVSMSYNNESPFVISDFNKMYGDEEFIKFLDDFPELAGKNKHTGKYEGTSLGDFLIIKEIEHVKKLYKNKRVYIWSLDQDLSVYS